MRLVYTPEGQDEPQVWEFALGKLRSQEVEHIERLTGLSYGTEYKDRLLKGNMLARRALLFTLLRRQHPHYKFADVDFADEELTLEQNLDELLETRKVIETLPAIPEAERPAVLEALDQQIAEERERNGEGKAPTPSGESATG